MGSKEASELRVELCRELPMIEHRLREAGLFNAATLMNKVVVRAGFESAELMKRVEIREVKPR
jgi:hypothetical protein